MSDAQPSHFEAGDLRLRLLRPDDVPLLVRWLTDPRLLEWYEGRDRPHTRQMVLAEYYVEDETTRCIVEWDGRPIGYQQFYPVLEDERDEYGYEPGADIWGMDQFIGEPDLWSRGLGTSLVTMVTAMLFDKGADLVAMDPQQRNLRALRCYEKAGFKIVRPLAGRELHEGKWEDCWLIERRR